MPRRRPGAASGGEAAGILAPPAALPPRGPPLRAFWRHLAGTETSAELSARSASGKITIAVLPYAEDTTARYGRPGPRIQQPSMTALQAGRNVDVRVGEEASATLCTSKIPAPPPNFSAQETSAWVGPHDRSTGGLRPRKIVSAADDQQESRPRPGDDLVSALRTRIQLAV